AQCWGQKWGKMEGYIGGRQEGKSTVAFNLNIISGGLKSIFLNLFFQCNNKSSLPQLKAQCQFFSQDL
ncbi:hypothetical protein, partial [Salmonella sp. gx-f7]|uniref:hypothetical protein n=1 Tax=Salmonella sp. gx-f7 TaxID=2582606 RepID=UPI001F20E632